MKYRNTLIFILSLFLFNSLQGQQLNNKKLRLGLYYAPSFANRYLTSESKNNIDQETYLKYRQTTEVSDYSNNMGFFFNYEFGKDFLFESGLSYENIKYERQIIKAYFPGFMDLYSGDKRIYFKYDFITIPLVIKYKYSFNRFIVSGGTGLNQNILINYSESGDLDSDIKEYGTVISSETKNYTISAIAKLGLDFRLNNEISIFFEPQFSYMLIPVKTEKVEINYIVGNDFIVDEQTIKERLYSLSLSFGIKF
ncbi:MAG: outer membrane beta-barrel protein [Salinivirgaceae bacterium]